MLLKKALPSVSAAVIYVVRSGGLMVTILRRLELVHEPYDGGPFLYLSPGNTENHAFALRPAPESACQ